MELLFLESTSSTQTHLIDLVKSNKINKMLAVFSEKQTSGIGSRGNSWIGESGNLFFSVAIKQDFFPKDIPIQSLSIYFSMIMKKIIQIENPTVFLKWANDLFIEKKKVGGVITTISKGFIICGMGINLIPNNDFGHIKTELSTKNLLEKFLNQLLKFPSWESVFKDYSSEFHKSKNFSVHVNNNKVLLKNAILNSDGSINIDGQTFFSFR